MSFKDVYTKEVVPKLQQEFAYDNVNAAPQLTKITLNIGLGKVMGDARYLETAEQTVQRITGQKPVRTLARKSIAAFKVREGNVVGLKVTLRGKRMWDFLEKLIKVTFPRIRDFRGLEAKKGFDGRGNYALGFKEHIAFPEIRSDEIEVIHGLQVNASTTARTNKEAQALLTHLGFPFQDDNKTSKS